MSAIGIENGVPGRGADAAIAWHYGDPLREQRVLTSSAAVVDRSNRDVLQVAGPERLAWLHSICSQHLSGLADGAATEALVLSPHGHVEQHWQLAELEGTVWIDTEPGAGPVVLDYLQTMRFLKRVEPVDVSASWAVLTVAGPRVADVVTAAGLPVPALGQALPLPGGGIARTADHGLDLLVPRADRDDVWASLLAAGAEPAGTWAFDALRVAARRPRVGYETDHRTIPHEVGWIGTAVHLDKGCYRGQETVARVHNLGRPPRTLVLLHLSGVSDELPEPGTPVELDGRTVGFLGTAVHHHELGPVALAVIKRQLAEDLGDRVLTVAGEPVALG